MNLRVTGTLVPDATGIYTERGTYNGEPYYESLDDLWFIWWTGSQWILSTACGNPSVHSWIRNYINVIGDYDPYLVTSGIATVASYIMGWRDYLKAEWEFNEVGSETQLADSKAGLYPIILPGTTVASDYTVAGKFAAGFCPNKIVSVSPYPRTAELALTDLVWNEFSLRFWMKINQIISTSIQLFSRETGGGTLNSYYPGLRIDEGDIMLGVGHGGGIASVGYSIDKGVGYYIDGVWREYLLSFKKQAATPRIKIFINGIDETNYARETSYDLDVYADVYSRFMIAGTVDSDYAEYALDRLQVFDKAMVPADFLGTEIIDQSLIYPGVPQLAGF
jgi:hypothetical protein